MTWSQNGIDYVCQKYGDINECVVSSGLVFDVIDIQGQTTTGLTGSTADIVAMITFNLITQITMTTPSRPPISDPFAALNQANGSTVTPQDAQELTNHDETSGDQWCYVQEVFCWECETAGSPCVQTGPHANCDHPDRYTTKAACEADTGCVSGQITCHRCKPVNGYSVPETQTFPGNECPEGWFVTQPPCNLPPCSFWDNQPECVDAGCYWCDGVCQSTECGTEPCAQYTDQPACEAYGCFWYKKWLWEEAKCHSTPHNIINEYLVYAGAGAAVIGIILIARRR